MIGKLTGVIDTICEDHVLIDVNGVGYIVFCPTSTLSKLTAGARLALMTEMRVSEDAIKLYGFLSSEEREWFRLLQSVQGVGAKVALAILTTLTPRDLQRALALTDKAMVGRAQGVGPKLALRIVTELKDKAPKMLGAMGGAAEVSASPAPAEGGARREEADAMSALVKLGYSESAAAEAVARAAREAENADAGSLIRAALKNLGR